LWGSIGSIVLAGRGSRFEANCYTELFIQIGRLVRKISIDKLFLTDRQTDTNVKLKTSFLDDSVLVESGNVLGSTSIT